MTARVDIGNRGTAWSQGMTGCQESGSTHTLRDARRALDSGRMVVLSCPQKVCLSGDYGDMHDGGQTFTAAIDVRPELRLRRLEAERSTILLRGGPVDLKEWDLLRAFGYELDRLNLVLEVDAQPSDLMGVGLGSSGAASVLLSTTLAIARNAQPTDEDLIEAAHQFENLVAAYPCGAQDHAASVFGGLNLLTFPSLEAKRVNNTGAWSALTFWTSDEPRAAFELIPEIANRHTGGIWARRSKITNRFADAFTAGDFTDMVGATLDESELQLEIGMVTSRQQAAIEQTTALGGAAKVSGAGGGGVLAVVAADDASRRSISEALTAMDFKKLELRIAPHGVRWTTAGPLRAAD